ncbi:MAG TPA: MTH1187 family thiamine-binding protein [Aquifex aeolicus]|nr:MTH1187 family thiamine-binding protein [Aquifex aeolicus]
MSFLVFVSMTPLGKGESVSKYVAKVVDIVDKSGLPYILTPMGTIIEGEDWDEVMNVLKKGFEALKEDCNRVSITMKIDYRKGKKGRLVQKVKSVQEKLGRDINVATVSKEDK